MMFVEYIFDISRKSQLEWKMQSLDILVKKNEYKKELCMKIARKQLIGMILWNIMILISI